MKSVTYSLYLKSFNECSKLYNTLIMEFFLQGYDLIQELTPSHNERCLYTCKEFVTQVCSCPTKPLIINLSHPVFSFKVMFSNHGLLKLFKLIWRNITVQNLFEILQKIWILHILISILVQVPCPQTVWCIWKNMFNCLSHSKITIGYYCLRMFVSYCSQKRFQDPLICFCSLIENKSTSKYDSLTMIIFSRK